MQIRSCQPFPTTNVELLAHLILINSGLSEAEDTRVHHQIFNNKGRWMICTRRKGHAKMVVGSSIVVDILRYFCVFYYTFLMFFVFQTTDSFWTREWLVSFGIIAIL